MDIAKLQKIQPAYRTKEYLAGGSIRGLSPLQHAAIQLLSRYQDDLNREFSDTVYDQMMRDPAVIASVDILRSLILSEPLRIISRVQDKQDARYKEAARIADFVDRQLRGMVRSTQTVMWEALESLAYGSALVELVLIDAVDEEGKPILKLMDLKTRHRSTYALVVDRYYNVLGAVSVEAGAMQGGIYTGQTNPDPSDIMPREKFWLCTPQSRNSDPRGISLIRAAYNAFFLKTQVWPAYLKFLVQFASPSIVAVAPPSSEVQVTDANGELVYNADGTPQMITIEQDILNNLLNFQNGTVAVMPEGTDINLVQSDGQGESFSVGIDLFDRQIAMAILKTHRTLLEAKHSSKADAESAADITDVFVANLREVIGAAFTRDVVRVLVALNFGEDVAAEYAPVATLQSMPKQDFSKAADAVGKLYAAGYLHTSQIAKTDAMIGLPERDMDAFLAEQEERQEAERLAQAERGKMLLGGGQGAADDEEAEA